MTDEPNSAAPMKGPVINQDVVAGALFILFGFLGYYFSLSLNFGTAADFGSAFFPRIISVLLTLLGAGILIRGLARASAGLEFTSPRPLLLVTVCVVLFAVTLERLGMVIALMLLVLVSSFAAEGLKQPVRLFLLGAGLSLACVAIFIWGAQLPIRVWP